MIRALAYIGFCSPATDEWHRFGPEVLGAELAPDGTDGTVRLRVDDAVHRIAIHPGDQDDLAYIGWDVGGPTQLDAAVTRLEAQGITVGRGDPDLADERGVAELAWFTDPFGFRHELTHGLRIGAPFTPGRPMGGFVTGEGGLGHIVLVVPDLVPAERLFVDVLGFTVSDTIEAGLTLRFLHCNPRHHSLALALIPGMVGVLHLMLEVHDLDDVHSALALVEARQLPLVMHLGQHPNDHTTGFYVRTPAGFDIEYGHGGLLIDDATWETSTYDTTSTWGHDPPPGDPLFPTILRPFDPAP